jgi:hypothetical protein
MILSTDSSPVTVRLPLPLCAFAAGQGELVCQGHTMRAVLQPLERLHPALAGRISGERGELWRSTNISVGPTNIKRLGGLDAPVAAVGELSLVNLAVGGGL